MSTIPHLINYGKNGHEFTVIARTGNLAIFKGVSRANGSETFELIEIQSHDGREIAGKFFEPAEFPPSNEQWGSKGWTFTNLPDAQDRMAEMVATGKESA